MTGETNRKVLVLTLLFVVEAGLLTYWRNFAGPFISPVIFFAISLLMAFLPFLWILKNEGHEPGFANGNTRTTTFSRLLPWLLFSIFIIWFIYTCVQLLNTHPVDYRKSDIIPTIQIMVKRFLAGENTNSLIHDFGYVMQPSYLPMHWLPFVPAEIFGFDYRWVSICFYATGMGLYQLKVSSGHSPLYIKIILTFLPVLFTIGLVNHNPEFFIFTAEGLITGYYLFLAYALLNGNIILIAIAVTLCLLSRFSLLPWLPVLFIVTFYARGWQFTLKLGAFIIAGILLLFIIPFFDNIALLKQNTAKAIDEWYPKEWQGEGAKPFHLFRGLGISAYFYEFYKGTINQKIWANRMANLIFTSLGTIVCLISYLKFKNIIKSEKLFLVLTLKFVLLVFYTTIHVPYVYLNTVPVAVSLMIIAQLASGSLAITSQVPKYKP